MADQAHTPDAGDAAALQTAERVLATAFAGRPRLELLTPLAAATWRNRVLRCRVLDAEPGVPDTVVFKQPRAGYDPDRAAWPTLSLLNEWAGLQFLGSLGLAPPLAPRLYGGDRAAGLVVLEDLTMLAEPAPAGPLDAELAELQIMP